MTIESDPRLVRGLAVFASAGAVFSMAVGLLGLLAWWLHIRFLETWVYGPVTMKVNTAACFVLLGLSLWLQRKQRPKEEPSTAKFAARVAAALVCVVGALSALEYIFGWHFGIDQFLSLDLSRDPTSSAHPGLMSPLTGTIFLLLGLALIVLEWGKKHWSWPAQFLCLGAMGGSVFGFATVFVMTGKNQLSLALPSAVTFPLLSAGILCARAEWVLGGLATGASEGARISRRVVPVALLVLGAIGWTISAPLLTTVHLSWIEATLLGMVCCGLLIGFIVWMAFVVDRSHTEQRLEVPRKQGMSIPVPDVRVHGQVEVRLRRNATAGFALAVLLTATLGVVSVNIAQKAALEQEWVARTHEVMAMLATTLREVDDVETASHGFLLTGENSFLDPYEKAESSVTQNLVQLRRMMADDPSQQKRLDQLEKQTDEQIALAYIRIAERQAGNTPTLQQLEQGKQMIDAARSTIDEMGQEERRLSQERAQQSGATRQLSKFVVTLASLLGVIFLVTAGLSVRRLIDMNAQAQAEIFALNADLERRFAQRTADLSESEARLAGVIHSAMDAIIAHDEQQRIVVFNSAAEKMFRCQATDALGQPIERFIPERFRKAHGEHIRKFADSGVTTRNMGTQTILSALRADGEEFPMEASISQMNAGGRRLFTIIVRDVSERLRAEANRLRLGSIVESTDSAILSKDLDGIVTSWNRGAELLYGYSEEEMLGKHISQIIPAELKGEEQELLRQVSQGQLVRRDETLRRRKDGNLIYVSLIISPVRYPSGKIVGASTIAHDITASKHRETMLREQAQLLDLAQVFVQDMDSRIVIWSRGAEELYGFSSGEAVGRISHQLLQTRFPGSVGDIEKTLSTEGRWKGELIHRRKDGGNVVVASTWILHRDLKGTPLHILEVNADITARKVAEQRLAASEERMRIFIERAPAALAMFDREMRYLFASHRWLSDYGLEGHDLRGKSHYEVFPEVPEHWKRLHQRGLAGEVLTADRDRFDRANGSVQWIKWEIRPWYEANGEVGGIVIFSDDITEDVRAEEALRESEGRLRALVLATSDIIYRMSPDWSKMHQLDGRGFIVDTTAPVTDWLQTYIPQGDQALVTRTIQNAIRNKSVFELEHRVRQADGSIGWTLSRAIPRLDANGEIVEWFGAASNVTRRKLAEESLRENHERLKKVLEVETVGVMFWDLTTGTLRDANSTFLNLMGYSRSDLEAGELTWQRLTPTEFQEVSREELRKLAATGRVGPYEKEYLHKDGTRQWFAFAGSSLGNDTCVEFCVDISARKEFEAALQDSERRVRTIMDSTAEAILGQDLEGNCMFCNPAALRLLGYEDQAELLGKNLDASLHHSRVDGTPLSPDDCPVGQAIRGGHLFHFDDLIFWRKNGTHFQAECWGHPVCSEGKTTGTVLTFFDISERKRTEAALRESEERFQAMANGIPQLAWMANPDGQIFWYNQRWYDYTGKTFEQMQGWGWQSVHDPEVLPRVLERWKDAIATGQTFDMEFPLRGVDGKFRVFLTRVSPFKDAEGKVVRWFGTNTDISERKRAEEAIRDSRARLEAALASMTDAVFISDLEGRLVDFNDAFATFHRFKSKAECIKNLAQYSDLLDVFMANGKLAPLGMWAVPRALRGETDTDSEYTVRRKDTGETWVGSYSFGPILDKDGAIAGAVVVARDITHKKAMDRELRELNRALEERVEERTARLHESEQRVRRKLDSILSPEGDLGDLDLSDILDLPAIEKLLEAFYSIVHVATGLVDLHGVLLTAVGFQNVCLKFHRVHPESCKNCKESDLHLSSGVLPGEFKIYKCKNNLWDVATPIVLGDRQMGNLYCGQFLLADEPLDHELFRAQARKYGFNEQEYMAALDGIPRLTRAEVDVNMGFLAKLAKMISQLSYSSVKLARSSAQFSRVNDELVASNRELESFTYSVSHDLRAPLRHIGGFSRILMEDFGPELAPEARDHIQRIEDGVQRMGLLVDELLNLGHVGRHALKLQRTDLNAIVEEVVSLLQPETNGRDVNWKIANLPPAHCDPILIRQVFQNFIANALKFTRPRERADIEISCIREKDKLVIAVRDNGVGFNMKYVDKLFGVFQRLHRGEDFEGTGIGLATVQRIVHKHEGRVWAEAEVDRGATFYFTLAAADTGLPAPRQNMSPLREDKTAAAGAQL